ncbi:separase [Dorcoceras hygrometricum]|uniref:Separase n=1 Tax=Dorcoceras hygrometricum TaxID=472368 RepID=A0A2Z6ZU53_9LAMI|nr:separase [Dorcoceras hygrometricum]
MNKLQALEEEDGSAADEERSAGARGPAGTEAEKSRKLELERESLAGAISVDDDISSDIIQQEASAIKS